MSQGLRDAGFEVVSAVDVDADSCESYRLNHPQVSLHEKDIRKVSKEDILAGRNDRITLLAGCPPCQGFTRLNEASEKSDPRNGLVLEYIRLVRELKPEVVLFENVPGLLKNGKWYFSRLRTALIDEGYTFNSKTLQLADYGTPQRRRRVIVLCGRGFDLKFPEQTHGSPAQLKQNSGLAPWITVRQALEATSSLGRPKRHATLLKEGGDPNPSWHVSRTLGEVLLKRLRATPKSGGSREDLPSKYELDCHSEFNGFHDVYGRLDWNKPSVTITGGCTNLSKGRFGHPENLRALTPREAALLQGFPVDYKFHGSGMESVCQQIGNALPPSFAKVVGAHVLDQLRKAGKIKG